MQENTAPANIVSSVKNDSEAQEAPFKRAKINPEHLPVFEGFEGVSEDELEDYQELDLYSPFIQRISECFLRSQDILDALNSDEFETFKKLWGKGVEAGLCLFEEFGQEYHKLDIREYSILRFSQILNDIDGLEDDSSIYLLQEELTRNELLNEQSSLELCMVNQLQQIRARWHTHIFIQQEKELIQDLKARNRFYPVLLSKFPQTKIKINPELSPLPRFLNLSSAPDGNDALFEKNTLKLSLTDIDWLLDLVHPHLTSPACDEEVAVILTERNHGAALLRFYHQLNLIHYMKSQEQKNMSMALSVIQRHVMFFKNFASSDHLLSEQFIAYLESCHSAKNFANILKRKLPCFLELLEHLDTNSSGFVELLYSRKPAQSQARNILKERYRTLLDLILESHLTGQLEMWVMLSTVGECGIKEKVDMLNALTFLEKYRHIIALSFTNNNPFSVWLEKQEVATRSYVHSFSVKLREVLTGGNVKEVSATIDINGIQKNHRYHIETPILRDVRPRKNKSKYFPDPMACFQDAFCGQDHRDPSSRNYAHASDVRLYEFMSHPKNKQLVDMIHFYQKNLSSVFSVYEQSIIKTPKVILDREAPHQLKDALNSPGKLSSSPLRKLGVLSRRHLELENVPSIEDDRKEIALYL